MAALIAREGIELVPVVELDPGKFSTRERRLPSGSGREVPEEFRTRTVGARDVAD